MGLCRCVHPKQTTEDGSVGIAPSQFRTFAHGLRKVETAKRRVNGRDFRVILVMNFYQALIGACGFQPSCRLLPGPPHGTERMLLSMMTV